MSAAKVTPWFPAEVKPVRVGVYVASANEPPNEDCYRFWDGKQWRGCEFRIWPGSSSLGKQGSPSEYQERIQWRGLASDPKESA